MRDVMQGVLLLGNDFFKLSELYCKWLFLLGETTARFSVISASVHGGPPL